MRHRRRVKHFSRKTGARKALVRGLVESLVEHGRIKTTLDKAKETRRHVERAITLGKKGTLSARRLILSRYPQPDVVKGIMDDLSVKFKDRSGGYTRIVKLGRRPGDMAEMAFIEFIDYDFTSRIAEGNSDSTSASSKYARGELRYKRKVRNKMQSSSRSKNRV